MRKFKGLLLTGLAMTLLAGCAGGNSAEETTEGVKETTIVSDTTAETTIAETETETEEQIVEVGGLKDVFAKYNMKTGVALTPDMTAAKFLKSIVTENFNSITMENAMKPDYILDKKKSVEAGDIVVEFNKDVIKMLDFAKENNFAVRGHTLVWYSQTPDWIFYENFDTNKELVGRDVMLARLDSYINQVFTKLDEAGYLEPFYAYDIVNEAWMENGSARENLWMQTIGDDYLWQSFYIADKYAPEHVDLYYNDYNEQYKADTLVRFVENLKDENGRYLIDGIGLQAHLYTDDNLEKYFATIDKLAATGLKLQLTELDVCLGSWQKVKEPTEDNLKEQGRYYYNLINGLLARVEAGTLNTDAITFWGFADGMSWRKESNPLLYSTEYQPKYAYYGAMQQKDKAGF